MSIREISDSKPYLRDVLSLYEKVAEFRRLTEDFAVPPGAVSYPAGSIDSIFKSFSSVFDMPEDILEPLKEAMKLGQVDLTRIPLNEVPAFSLPYHEDELSTILFLISKPYFLRLRGPGDFGETFWDKGRCGVCGSVPSLSFLKQDDGRILSCSYCESRGKWFRIGCPQCLNRDGQKIEIIETDEEKGFRIDLCNACKSYVKTIRHHLLDNYGPDLLDIMSLPLDILAQERAYRRLSPNPVGMRKIS
jgi:FdhE protein